MSTITLRLHVDAADAIEGGYVEYGYAFDVQVDKVVYQLRSTGVSHLDDDVIKALLDRYAAGDNLWI